MDVSTCVAVSPLDTTFPGVKKNPLTKQKHKTCLQWDSNWKCFKSTLLSEPRFICLASKFCGQYGIVTRFWRAQEVLATTLLNDKKKALLMKKLFRKKIASSKQQSYLWLTNLVFCSRQAASTPGRSISCDAAAKMEIGYSRNTPTAFTCLEIGSSNILSAPSVLPRDAWHWP